MLNAMIHQQQRNKLRIKQMTEEAYLIDSGGAFKGDRVRMVHRHHQIRSDLIFMRFGGFLLQRNNRILVQLVGLQINLYYGRRYY